MSSATNKITFQRGAIAAFALMGYSILTLLIMVFLGGPPVTIEECYTMLSENKFYGALRLDILTVFAMPLYYVLFFSVYKAMNNKGNGLIPISTLFVFAGVTLFLATPSVFSYLHLSKVFDSATTETEKNNLIAAGQAILASDMWHGTGARVGGILLQSGAVIISFVMLGGNEFSKLTAYTGILTHGLDLIHILVGFLLPDIGNLLMMIAGPLYFLWFPLIGVGLFKLTRPS